jgi:hypothetical protein
VAKQALNRLYVFALTDKEGREAVAEVVESESLSGFEADSNLNRGLAYFILRHHAGTERCFALRLCGRENPIIEVRLQPLPVCHQPAGYGYREGKSDTPFRVGLHEACFCFVFCRCTKVEKFRAISALFVREFSFSAETC